ncbi:Pde4d [Symbiodinium natans]|uniref:Phosphodiesterase n=1 Tax=Symbiodinium natans TaxID=878477 RepID=A0A812RW41_9DINO|nr:Pde4d [Symbiodinium natans]
MGSRNMKRPEKLPELRHASREAPPRKWQAQVTGCNIRVISSKLISRVSSTVACLIILSVQVLPLPGTFSYPTQDFSIQMWTEHLSRSIEESTDPEKISEIVNQFRAFYDRTAYKPYVFLNGTQVLWESRGPLQPDRSVRIQDGAVSVLFDFTTQVQVEAALNMSIITITIILMLLFSLLISRAIARHALAPLETMLLKVRKIGRLIWLQVESIHTLLSNSKQNQNKNDEKEEGDETVLLKEVLGRISLLSALKLIRPDEDAQAVVFLGTGVASETVRPSNTLTMQHREMIQSRLQTVVHEDLSDLEVENLTSWRFNPLDLETTTTCFVCAKLLSTYMPSAIKANGVTETEISAFIATVEEGYLKSVPYHNWSHAVDVMHSAYVLLQDLREAFSRTERYALLICAVVHDIQHPGVSNEFLVQTHHDLAMRYNDNAPLESMHCARLFEILADPSTNVWGVLEDGPRKDIRKMCIEAILHTDNSCHFNVVKACQMIHEVHDEVFSNVLSTHGSVEDHKESWPSPEVLEILGEKETHDTLRNMLLHFADISNSMKPFAVARPWALLVLEEFFAQGEKMTELGLPVPALNDRQKTNRPTSQIGFIEFIVSPLVFTIVKILPPLGYTEQAMWGNVKSWFEEWASTANPSKSEFQQMATRITSLYEKVTFAK